MAGKKFPISTPIKADDQLSKPAQRAARRFAQAWGRATGKTVKDTRRMTRETKKMTRSMAVAGRFAARIRGMMPGGGLIGGLIGVAGVYAMSRQVQKFADYTDHIGKFSRTVGLAVGEYQRYRYAANRASIETSLFDRAMVAFSKRLGDAKAGTGALQTFLKRVSPTLLKKVTEANSVAEAFEMMIDAIHKLPDAERRSALAAAAFSRAGTQLVVMAEEGVGGLKKLGDQSEKYYLITKKSAAEGEKMGDALVDLRYAAGGLRDALMSRLQPALLPVVESMSEWIVKNREWLTQKVDKKIKAFVAAIRAVDWDKQVKRLKAYYTSMAALVDRIGGARLALFALGLAVSTVVLPALGGLAMLLATPWGLAVAGLVTAATLTYTHWDEVRELFKNLETDLPDSIKTAADAVQMIVKDTINALSGKGREKTNNASREQFFSAAGLPTIGKSNWDFNKYTQAEYGQYGFDPDKMPPDMRKWFIDSAYNPQIGHGKKLPAKMLDNMARQARGQFLPHTLDMLSAGSGGKYSPAALPSLAPRIDYTTRRGPGYDPSTRRPSIVKQLLEITIQNDGGVQMSMPGDGVSVAVPIGASRVVTVGGN